MVLAGVAVLAWVLVVWRWQDPFTALYTHWKQHQLAQSYKHRFAEYQPTRLAGAGVSVSTTRRTIAREARLYRLRSHRGTHARGRDWAFDRCVHGGRRISFPTARRS